MNEKKNAENIGFKSTSVGEAIIFGIMGLIIGFLLLNVWGLIIVLLFYAVNGVAALTWEKNENIRTKSKLKIFFSPVIKGVIIGAGTGAIIYSMISAYAYAYNSLIYGIIIGSVFIGVCVGLMQLMVEPKLTSQTTLAETGS